MENINLTENEKKELEKRGFYVKKVSIYFKVVKGLYAGLFYTMALSGIGYLLFPLIKITYLTILVGIIFVTPTLYKYSFSSLIFYGKFGTIAFGKKITRQELYAKLKQKGLIGSHLRWLWNNIISNSGTSGTKVTNYFLVIYAMTILAIIGSTNFSAFLIKKSNYEVLLGIFFLTFALGIISLGLGLLSWIGNFIITLFHPLYAFGNIGMKIQKVTPEIESQSKLIQAGFQEDMNFSILHSGFEELSVIFSRIVELVLKLEKVEKRANKGNLFDSVKYIDSLRTDIMTPLIELKVFLEKQRGVLLESQQELGRVIVGASSELCDTQNIANKRGEMLLEELDTNIEKLEGMLYKLA